MLRQIMKPKKVGLFMPCSSICLIAGHKVPLTKSVIFSVTESSPAIEYCLLRSSNSSTNLAGNHPKNKNNVT